MYVCVLRNFLLHSHKYVFLISCVVFASTRPNRSEQTWVLNCSIFSGSQPPIQGIPFITAYHFWGTLLNQCNRFLGLSVIRASIHHLQRGRVMLLCQIYNLWSYQRIQPAWCSKDEMTFSRESQGYQMAVMIYAMHIKLLLLDEMTLNISGHYRFQFQHFCYVCTLTLLRTSMIGSSNPAIMLDLPEGL